MLSPKRTKYRKAHKGRIHGNAKGGYELNFGAFGLKAVEPARLTERQIEAARRAITRHLKRVGRVWSSMLKNSGMLLPHAATLASRAKNQCWRSRPC